MIKANDIEMVKLGGMTPEERKRYEKNSLRYASSFLKEAKNVSATALSCGRAVAEKDCFTSHFCSNAVNAADVYCLPRSL